MEICQKIFTPHAPPFKVTQCLLEPTQIDRLPMFRSNYSPISYRFRDKWR